MKENRDVLPFAEHWKGWTHSLYRHSIMPCCHNTLQVNIVVYLEERLQCNLKNMKGRDKKVEPCSLPLKVHPISQCSGCSFEAKRQLGWHIAVVCTYGIFIHVHKQFLLSWVDQWVSDKWYLSSFIHWLRIHGVCRIGKNKSIFKQLKNIVQGSFSLSFFLSLSLSKPAIIPHACILCYLG